MAQKDFFCSPFVNINGCRGLEKNVPRCKYHLMKSFSLPPSRMLLLPHMRLIWSIGCCYTPAQNKKKRRFFFLGVSQSFFPSTCFPGETVSLKKKRKRRRWLVTSPSPQNWKFAYEWESQRDKEEEEEEEKGHQNRKKSLIPKRVDSLFLLCWRLSSDSGISLTHFSFAKKVLLLESFFFFCLIPSLLPLVLIWFWQTAWRRHQNLVRARSEGRCESG